MEEITLCEWLERDRTGNNAQRSLLLSPNYILMMNALSWVKLENFIQCLNL